MANTVSTSGLVQVVGDWLYGLGLVDEYWAEEATDRAEMVKLYREYYRGEHRAKLTAEMKDMLRISGDVLDQFNMNYCGLVVDTISDRLKVEMIEAVEGSGEPSGDWVGDVLRFNRFDGLQADLHHAVIRDGDGFVWVDPLAGADGGVMLVLEEAFDTVEGCMVVYDKRGRDVIAFVKIWEESYRDDSYRVNVYLRDGYHRFSYGGDGGGGLSYLADEDGGLDNPLGYVPVVHFKLGAKGRRRQGQSAISNIIPLQDALNRTLTSMVMTAELSSFQIKWARGIDPPSGVRPGMWVSWGDYQADNFEQLRGTEVGVIAQAELVPFIEEAMFLINRISDVGRCPLPNMGSSAESGEARKMRESLLLGLVDGFSVKAGNAWEDVLWVAHGVYGLYVGDVPAVVDFNARWASAVVLDEEDVRKKSEHLHKMGYEREALRVLGYDEAQVDKLMMEKLGDSQASARTGLEGLFSLENGIGALA